MVFNRKRNAKVKWERQVESFRKQKKEQLASARAQATAISDHSDTQRTGESTTNASEVEMIMTFANNDNYGNGADGFTLGGNTPEDFEPIADMGDDVGYHQPMMGNNFQNARAGFGMNNFAPDTFDEDTYDNMNAQFGKSNESGLTGAAWGGQGSYHLEGMDHNNMNAQFGVSNESGFTGEGWGGQRSYHLDGIDNTTASESTAAFNRRSKHGVKTQTISTTRDTSYTDDGSTDDDDDESSMGRYRRKYDLQEGPERVSQVMLVYDAILTNPILTVLAAPCIPCLAVYVKTNETNPNLAPERRKSQSKRRSKRGTNEDDTFAEYNAQRKRFEDISQTESRSEIDSFDGRNARDRRRPASMGTEFSYINSNGGTRFGGPGSSGGGAGGYNSEFSNIASGKYGPNSDLYGPNPGSEFSNMVPGQYAPNYTPINQEYYGNMNMGPDSRQSSGAMGYSQGFDSATDRAGSFIPNVPQGQWQGDLSGTFDASGRRVGFRMDGNNNTSDIDGNATFSITTEGFGNQGNGWGQVGDSISRGHGGPGPASNNGSYGWRGQNVTMGPGYTATEDATFDSSMPLNRFIPGR